MFSLKIVDTDEFLDMPPTTQNLYFHLCMRADDDGFVSNPKKIMKIVNSATDDIKVLIGKKFVIPFESGVCVIKHWKIHNLIRKDRYTETEYKKEKKLLTEQDNKYKLDSGIQNDNQMATNGCRRLGKVRLGKVSKEGFEKQTTRKKISFLKADYERVEKAYQKYREIELKGQEWLPVQQAIKSMFMSKRSVEDIIGCMKWLAGGSEEWMENWTINTAKMKMPFFVANKNKLTYKKY